MDEVNEILESNRLEDVTWLCSLSESELDLLISLKKLVIQRAKIIGHEELAKNFDLQLLRALALVLMEYARGRVKDTSLAPTIAEKAAFMDSCNLLKSNVNDTLGVEEIRALLCKNSRRKARKRPREK